jgi:hypothetical protein
VIRVGIRLAFVIALLVCAAWAKTKSESYISIDHDRTVEITHDGKVLHVSATDTSGKTKCTVAALNDDKGFSIICTE